MQKTDRAGSRLGDYHQRRSNSPTRLRFTGVLLEKTLVITTIAMYCVRENVANFQIGGANKPLKSTLAVSTLNHLNVAAKNLAIIG